VRSRVKAHTVDSPHAQRCECPFMLNRPNCRSTEHGVRREPSVAPSRAGRAAAEVSLDPDRRGFAFSGRPPSLAGSAFAVGSGEPRFAVLPYGGLSYVLNDRSGVLRSGVTGTTFRCVQLADLGEKYRGESFADSDQRTKKPRICGAFAKRLKGLEPSTFCMASRRSSQLSYSRAAANYRGGIACMAELMGTSSLVTRPRSWVSSSTIGNRVAMRSGVSIATVTIGTWRRIDRRRSPWGAWLPWKPQIPRSDVAPAAFALRRRLTSSRYTGRAS
jgi:hypothetical protein